VEKLNEWFKKEHEFNKAIANDVQRLLRHSGLPDSPTGTPTPPPPPK
jgi:hypothetical protein